MKEAPKREVKMTLSEAMSEIGGIMQNIRMGPTDAEPDLFENIKRAMQDGDITIEEAIIQARNIEYERSSHYR